MKPVAEMESEVQASSRAVPFVLFRFLIFLLTSLFFLNLTFKCMSKTRFLFAARRTLVCFDPLLSWQIGSICWHTHLTVIQRNLLIRLRSHQTGQLFLCRADTRVLSRGGHSKSGKTLLASSHLLQSTISAAAGEVLMSVLGSASEALASVLGASAIRRRYELAEVHHVLQELHLGGGLKN